MPLPEHIDAVAAVNAATTQWEHDLAEAHLRGFRAALKAVGCTVDLLGCDEYYLAQGSTRPMCCGVFLDWEPRSVLVAGDGSGALLRPGTADACWSNPPPDDTAVLGWWDCDGYREGGWSTGGWFLRCTLQPELGRMWLREGAEADPPRFWQSLPRCPVSQDRMESPCTPRR